VRDRALSPLPWLAALLALYLLAPIAAFLVRLTGGVSSAPGLGGALVTSLYTATISATVIALLGVPLAYLLAQLRGARGRVALALVALPLALPPLMSGLLLLYVLGPYTTAGRLFGGNLTDTRAAIVLAQTFVAAPFLIVTARAAFVAVDPALDDMARALGHRRLARFWHVAVPAALPGIGAGLLLAWLRSFGEFGATVILAYHPYSLPVFTYVQFGSTGLPATMLPIAVALAAAFVVLMLSGVRAPRRRGTWPGGGRAWLGRSRTWIGGGRMGADGGLVAEPTSPPRAVDGLPPALDFSLSKRLGEFSLQLEHRAGSPRLALLGPSGAGKTLTLRLLAGLTASDGGHVRSGTLALDQLACERRRLGYVPQSSALVPRRTVWRQVTFGARARPQLAAWWIERLGLSGLEDRYPDELSGGQQRRVALARALAVEPRMLLLDEPFTGLDAPVRDRLRRDLRRLQRDGALSTVIVTHDPEEAAMLADDIIVIDHGRALQAGTRQEVFRAPCSAHVAGLLGVANVHSGQVVGADAIVSEGVRVGVAAHGLAEGTEVAWCVRPERVLVEPPGGEAAGADRHFTPGTETEEGCRYDAALIDDIDLGSLRELTVAVHGKLELTARTSDTTSLELGSQVQLRIERWDICVWVNN
jgi:ABC-type Fe3+/spermidine/putrescine transport system ATPase subunit/ABC-type sulfate transport system permease component